MSECLIEFLSEEVPARMQLKAAEDLKLSLELKLKEAGLAYGHLRTFVTPRRLTAVIEGLASGTPASSQERRGPRVGAPEAALEGFLKSAGLSREACTQKDGYWYGKITVEAQETKLLLPSLIRSILKEFSWPKSMRWAGASQTWVRPLRGVLVLFEGTLVPFELPEFGLFSTSQTVGHRFLSPTSFEVKGFADYQAKLRESHVILDHQERQQVIEKQLIALGLEKGYQWERDQPLLEEVAGLVEFPQALLGAIEPRFMALPKAVLATSMRVHQKYFTFVDEKGAVAPIFGFVANTIPSDDGAQMLQGYQRVLAARLSDALFFYELDLKIPLEDSLEKLKAIVFHAQLGSLGQRVSRLHDFVELAESKRAALLCKGDLVSTMVGEFPELQGIMGEEYARAYGEAPAVALAIREHYQPQGPLDGCPTEPVSVELALAEKLDTLVGFFGIGEMPTGSKDPYALRRAALGVIRLIRENKLEAYPLRQKIERFVSLYAQQGVSFKSTFTPDVLIRFILERLAHGLKGEGLRYDAITAVMSSSTCGEDILTIGQRTQALHSFLDSDSGIALQGAFRRAYGILSKEEIISSGKTTKGEGLINTTLFLETSEKNLYDLLSHISEHSTDLLHRRDYRGLMEILSDLRTPVDAFFDLKINHDDPQIRSNRLGLLALLVEKTALIADFSKLEGL